MRTWLRIPSSSLARLAWSVVRCTLYRISFRTMHGWRCMLLRLFGAKVGRRVLIHANVRVWAPWNLELGDYVWVGEGANLYSMDKIIVEDYAVVSQGVHLCCGSHDPHSENFQLIAAPIIIRTRAWICTEAFVAPGVEIAEGVVLGARGLASKSIDVPWTIWAGVPARQIGVRRRAHTVLKAVSQ